jgi:hypothetical protein
LAGAPKKVERVLGPDEEGGPVTADFPAFGYRLRSDTLTAGIETRTRGSADAALPALARSRVFKELYPVSGDLWRVGGGGWLYGSCAAASRDEYGEEQAGLSDVFGFSPRVAIEVQSGRFDLRGALNALPWLDQVTLASDREGFGALGLKVKVSQTMAKVTGTFKDGTPAVLLSCVA